jgi:putative FmdB family regulatory protein
VPTYDYRCSSCGERVEIVHSISGGPPETCPNCGAFATLRKAFAPPTIVFKGSGWAKKERHAAASKSRSSGTSSEDGSDSKSDTGEGPKKKDGDDGVGKSGDAAKPTPTADREPAKQSGGSGTPKAEPAGS